MAANNNTTLSIVARNATLNGASGITPLLNSGFVKLYTGTQPATPDTALSGNTLLVSLALSSTAFGSPSSGSASANSIASNTCIASGLATFARWFASNGTTAHMDCTVGWAAQQGAWQASTAYTLGQTVSNNGNVYACTTAGTSAGSGGPTGTGSSISDNTVVWAYQGEVGDLNLANPNLVLSETVSISSFTLTHP
jgi:hypothetical protein